MDKADILIVESDDALRESLCETLELAGFSVIALVDAEQALKHLDKLGVRLVISDSKQITAAGESFSERLRQQFPQLPSLLMTDYGGVHQAAKSPASNYLIKPFTAAVLIRLVSMHLAPRVEPVSDQVVEDPGMQRLLALADRVAQCEATVLIQGESGVGKEVFARRIHRNSARRNGAFIAINCAAIPDNMLEAELFGYEKGAYTGAVQSVPGRFELAQGGTLLLDEISEMPMNLQAKLLRVLQEREMERLGGRRTIRLDVRVLATSNRNLKQQVTLSRFREDLYYRISVFPLTIPPLRERRADILPLTQSMLKKYNRHFHLTPGLSPEAKLALQNYAWPGNVRELENVVQRALILCSGESIQVEDFLFEDDSGLPGGVENPTQYHDQPGGLDQGLRSVEEKIILETLLEENGSRKSTAQRLGISQRTLRYKLARMRESGLVVPGI